MRQVTINLLSLVVAVLALLLACAPAAQPSARAANGEPSEFRFADGVRCYVVYFGSPGGGISCVQVQR